MLQKKEHGRGDTCGMMDSDVHGFLEASFSLSPIDKQVKEQTVEGRSFAKTGEVGWSAKQGQIVIVKLMDQGG